MIVAINTIFFGRETEQDFLNKVIEKLTSTHPEHTFLIISTKEPGGNVLSNVRFINPGPPPFTINKWFFWMYFKLKQVLKTHQPDVLVNNGDALFHFKKVPQIVLNPDLRFLRDPKSVSAGVRRVYELFGSRFYQKVQAILVFSQLEKELLWKKFRLPGNKIEVIPFGADWETEPIRYEERETIKEKYAQGFEYFLCPGFISESKHLVTLLKSFSAFKRRQRSSMQLLFMGAKGIHFDAFQKSLALYKYKEDVHLLIDFTMAERDGIIASAYALIFPDPFDNRAHLLLNALACEVPSIVSNAGSLSEAGADAVLGFEAGNIPDLAGKMMHVFKDEKSRKKLIENSKAWIEPKKFEGSISATWEIIEKLQR